MGLAEKALARLANRAPVAYAPRSAGFASGLLDRSDLEAQMRAYGSVSTLFAIVSGLTEAESQVNWRLWRKAASGKKEDRVEVTRHAALDLWNKPNDFYSRNEFVEVVAQHRELTGEEWWIVVRAGGDRGVPLELWPVRPDRMLPVPDPDEFISHYVYTSPDGQRVRLERGEVIHVKLPNPLDIYRGMGPVQALLADLDSTRYSAEWNRNFFINGAEPGGIIEAQDRLSDDEFDEFTSRWREQHQGVANAHRVALLERMKWVERKFSMRDMQFVELRHVSREIIREAFRFPVPLLGTVDNVNRANALAADLIFSRWLIVPRLRRRRSILNERFLPMFGKAAAQIEFDFDPITVDDPEQDNADRDSQTAGAERLVRAGYDPDDVAQAMGLPEMRYIGTGSTTTPEPDGQPQPDGLRDRITMPGPRPLPHAGGHGHTPRNQSEFLDPDVKRELDEQLSEVQTQWEYHLNRLLGDWQSVSADQRAELREQIQQAVDAGDLAALSRLTASSGEAGAVLTAAMIAIAALSASLAVREASSQDVDLEPAEPDRERLTPVAGAVAALLAAGLAQAAGREALRITRPDSSGADVARQVDTFLGDMSDRPLRDQLGGALTAAQNRGRVDTFKTAPSVAYYASEHNDSRVCGPCSEVDGRWLGNAEPGLDMVNRTYPSGGYIHCEGGIRCRGTVIAILRPEQVGPDGDDSAAF